MLRIAQVITFKYSDWFLSAGEAYHALKGINIPECVKIIQNRSEWTFKCFSIERSMNEDFLRWVGEK